MEIESSMKTSLTINTHSKFKHLISYTEFSSSVTVAAEDKREDFYSSDLHVSDKTFELKPETAALSSISDIEAKPLKAMPAFVKSISSIEVVVEDVAKFTVTITGFPKPSIQWFYNSKKLTTSSNCKFVYDRDEYSLIIPYAKFTDEGEYTCSAANVLGTTSCSAYLKIKPKEGTGGFRTSASKPPVAKLADKKISKEALSKEIVSMIPTETIHTLRGQPPHFFKELKSLQCPEGLPAKFDYVVKGEPVPEVLWYKENYQIHQSVQCNLRSNPDGSGSLTINNAQKEDSGLYSCKAFNSFGETTCTAELIVFSGTFATVEHKKLEVVQKHHTKSYTKTVGDHATESRLFMVKLPGEAQAELQDRDQLVYTIASEGKHSVHSEQTGTLHDVTVSTAEAAIAGKRQIIMHSQTTQESLGYIEQHYEPIKSPPMFELSSTEVQLDSTLCLPTIEEKTIIPKEGSFSIRDSSTIDTKTKTKETSILSVEKHLIPSSRTVVEKEISKTEPAYSLHSYKVEGDQEPHKEALFGFEIPALQKCEIQKERKMEVHTAVAMEQKKIKHEMAEDIQILDEAREAKSFKELPKPFLMTVTESQKSLAKESLFKVPKADTQQASVMKDKVVKTALTAEEKQQLTSEHTKAIFGLDDAISLTSKKEEKTPLHLQIVKGQDTLPKETTFTFEVLTDEKADLRRSPILLHSLLSEEPHLLPYEYTTPLSDVKDAIRTKPVKEHMPILSPHYMETTCILDKERMRPDEKPASHGAAHKLEKAYSYTAVVEEKAELLAERTKTLEKEITSVQAEVKSERSPEEYLPAVTVPMHLSKEKCFTVEEKEQRAVINKLDDTVKQFSTITEIKIVEDGSLAISEAVSAATCEDKYESKLPSVSVQVKDKAMPIESIRTLEAAEEDFAARIQEGQSVRFPLLHEEKQLIEEEHSSGIKRSEQKILKVEKQPHETQFAQVIQESNALHKETAFKVEVPKAVTLDVSTQIKKALQSALASEHCVLSSILLGSIEQVKIKELKVQKEPKYSLYTYQLTNINPPIDITLSFEGEYPQKADLRKELIAAFHAITHEQQRALLAEELDIIPLPTDRLEKLCISITPAKEMISPEAVNIAESTSEVARYGMHMTEQKMQTAELIQASVTKERPAVSKKTVVQEMIVTTESEDFIQEFKSVETIKKGAVVSHIRDVGGAIITSDALSAPVPVEQPTEILKKEKKIEELIVTSISKPKKPGETPIKITKDIPVITEGLTDIIVDEDSEVKLSTVITKVNKVNWYINGKKIISKNEFKCLQKLDTYSLIINNVQKEDHQGEYVCEALNEAGKATTSAKLTVIIRGWIMGIKSLLIRTSKANILN
ncbi:titin-like [Mustelus asterias]